MGTPTARSIVLVPFPFSDLSQTKLRQSIILVLFRRFSLLPYDLRLVGLLPTFADCFHRDLKKPLVPVVEQVEQALPLR